jgi:hypothetical protein
MAVHEIVRTELDAHALDHGYTLVDALRIGMDPVVGVRRRVGLNLLRVYLRLRFLPEIKLDDPNHLAQPRD